MTPRQRQFLEIVAKRIPELFAIIEEGNVKAEHILGDRVINQRQVRLKLIAEVVDAGANPLATHSARSQKLESDTSEAS
ncbi:MAG: hypothetical protein KTR35_18315 [Gammaproteobacteria bacterium]|nr:hypothetical protein [Gammaproteobacteria bacterium]